MFGGSAIKFYMGRSGLSIVSHHIFVEILLPLAQADMLWLTDVPFNSNTLVLGRCVIKHDMDVSLLKIGCDRVFLHILCISLVAWVF